MIDWNIQQSNLRWTKVIRHEVENDFNRQDEWLKVPLLRAVLYINGAIFEKEKLSIIQSFIRFFHNLYIKQYEHISAVELGLSGLLDRDRLLEIKWIFKIINYIFPIINQSRTNQFSRWLNHHSWGWFCILMTIVIWGLLVTTVL